MLRIVLVKAMGQAPTQALAAEFSEKGGVIGRASSCTLHLPDPYQHISREQVRVSFEGGQYFVSACGIANIVSLNGQDLTKNEPVAVRSGDVLTVGEFELRAEESVSEPPASTQAPVDSPTQFWNSLASPPAAQANTGWPSPGEASQSLHGQASDPFANLFSPPNPSSKAPATAGPGPLVSAIPDDFDIWGDLPGAGTQPKDPFALPAQESDFDVAKPAPFETRAERAQDRDALSLGHATPTSAGIAGAENIDDLFGLGGSRSQSSSDPLGLLDSKQKRQLLPGEDLGQFGGILNQPKGHVDAPFADQTPEIYGTFNLPKTKESPAVPKADAPNLPSPSTPLPILPSSAIQEIAAQVASEHPYVFEDTPKTQATNLLDELNQQSMRAQLKQKLQQSDSANAAASLRAPVGSSVRPSSVVSESAKQSIDQVKVGHEKGHSGLGTPVDPQFNTQLLNGFLRGLKLEKLPKTALSLGQPDAGLTPELMERIGGILRISTQATLDLLAARSLLKREMKTEVTMIVSKDNNPLKFSPDSESALAHLLSPIPIRGFLSPEDSVQDAFDDLSAHQMAFVAGMRAAIQSLVTKFDPQILESRLTKKSMIESMVPATRKAKLWERFSELYADISREAEDDFEAFFGKEFVKAYESQISQLDQKNNRS